MKMQVALLVLTSLATQQLTPRMASLVAAVRPVLPFPAATPAGDLPDDHSAAARWFVVWPRTTDDTRVIVRANPLHPEVQEAAVAAMAEINAAVAEAERRAQESYDRALEQLRKTGKSTELEIVTLDDEGVAGDRIDAALEATIELAEATSFDVSSAEAPIVTEGIRGASWAVAIPANSYRVATAGRERERFRPAETRIYFGLPDSPVVTRPGTEPLFRVSVASRAGAFSVVIRGNAQLVRDLAANADWSQLAAR